MKWKLALAALAALILAVFAAQNAELVEVRFLFWHVELSRALLMAGLFLLGGIAGWLVGAVGHLHRQRKSGG